MRRIIVLVGLCGTLLTGAAAQAHGIPINISIDAGQLVSLATLIYKEEDSQLTLTATGVKGAIGFYPQFGVFPSGQALTIDASGSELHPIATMYSDGTGVDASPVTALLTRTGISMSVSPTDTFIAGGTLPAYNGTLGGHSALTITLPTDAPNGLYAFGFLVSNPTFGQAETVWAVGNYGLTDPALVDAGLAAMRAQVPEPSALALAMCGGAGLAIAAWRRRRVLS